QGCASFAVVVFPSVPASPALPSFFGAELLEQAPPTIARPLARTTTRNERASRLNRISAPFRGGRPFRGTTAADMSAVAVAQGASNSSISLHHGWPDSPL